MMNNVIMTKFPQVYTRQNDKILNDFKINSTCFTKVTIRVTGIDDPACKVLKYRLKKLVVMVTSYQELFLKY